MRAIDLTFRWPMGHRILGLEGSGAKCRNIHGHNWQAKIHWANPDGHLEFGAVKMAVDGWIAAWWDHGFILATDDPFAEYLAAEGLKMYTLAEPPTTEAIAEHLAHQMTRVMGREPLSVHVAEGFRNGATWIPDE